MLLAKNYFIIYAKWTLLLCTYFPSLSLATSTCRDSNGNNPADWAILYKAPAQAQGKLLTAGAGAANWAANAAAVTAAVGHSFAKALEHVIAANGNNKFISYNNIPPDVPKVRTKSNSKGVLMMDTGNNDAAAWIVHTVPGFPKARTGYLFPPAEIQKGHLLICLTIKEDQIDTIVTQDTTTTGAQSLKVTIYSKGEKSRYEIYRRVLVRKLKTSIKVWTTRDKFLKSDCKTFGRNLKLVTSPISVDGHASSLENDVSQWIVSEPGNKFCVVDKPYHKSQAKEPAMAVCIDDATIFAMTLRIATPLIYYNDIPDAQMDSRPNLKKLANGESRLTPPLTVTQDTTTTGAQSLKVTIYSKGEKSRYVWTTRDKFLKSDCKTFGRNLKLVTSPISVDGHASSLENDVSQWIVSEPGNKFCVVDKPYHKSQAKEPAMAVCIDDATIFGHFNRIAQNVENCV
ncbi:Deoxyribonuclease-2-beta [Trichinella sp. T6]|nr:Deoxyribonuclease-2-beta [Trichinella sp. T6]